jgi:hypothetical protein
MASSRGNQVGAVCLSAKPLGSSQIYSFGEPRSRKARNLDVLDLEYVERRTRSTADHPAQDAY